MEVRVEFPENVCYQFKKVFSSVISIVLESELRTLK